MTTDMVDYPVVGGGSFFNVLLSRRSVDVPVRALEAGRRDRSRHLLVCMQIAVVDAVGTARQDWLLARKPKPHLDGGRPRQPRAKDFDVPSSISGLIYTSDLGDVRWADVTGEHGWDHAYSAPHLAQRKGAIAPATVPTRQHLGAASLVRGSADNLLTRCDVVPGPSWRQ